ncbi:MAG: hypothetical protein MHM6MM_004870 [Cercozoa sp. M6MM]
MVMKAGSVSQLGLDAGAVLYFMQLVRQDYQLQPYHNWPHAFYVLLFAWRALHREPEFLARLEPLECLAVLLSAACHDLAHPGYTNAHLATIGAERARMYNGSFSERYSIDRCRVLLRESDEQRGLLAPLSAQQRQSLHDMIGDLILCTDIMDAGVQQSVRERWHEVLRRHSPFDVASDINVEPVRTVTRPLPTDLSHADRMGVLRLVLLCSDIGAVTDHFEECAVPWVRRLFREFYKQSLESPTQAALKIDPFLDGQMKFLTLYARPLLQRLTRVGFLNSFYVYMDRLDGNIDRWRRLSAHDKQRYFAADTRAVRHVLCGKVPRDRLFDLSFEPADDVADHELPSPTPAADQSTAS